MKYACLGTWNADAQIKLDLETYCFVPNCWGKWVETN